MEFVDTHCHLDDDAYARDLPQVFHSARAAGVNRFINIGYEPESWKRSIALASEFPGLSYALGMHPNAADRWTNETATELERLLATADAVAVGETGLDYFRDRVDRSSQRAAFRDQLELARRFALPVIIHMRGEVEEEIASNLKDFPDVRAVFHSFDGSPELRDFALQREAFFGLGGLMTRAGSVELRETLRSVPLESIVLETDAPYLTPKGVKNRRNSPAHLPVIAQAVAELFGVPIERVAEETTANATAVFSLRSTSAAGAAR